MSALVAIVRRWLLSLVHREIHALADDLRRSRLEAAHYERAALQWKIEAVSLRFELDCPRLTPREQEVAYEDTRPSAVPPLAEFSAEDAMTPVYRRRSP